MPALPTPPDWLPGWAFGLIFAVGALYLLVLLAMPFSVFGLKGRLDELDMRLDDLHADIQAILRRLPAARGERLAEDPPAAEPPALNEPPLAKRGVAAARREPRLGPPPA